MKISKEYIRLNRNLLICFALSASITAGVAQFFGDQINYLNTTITIAAGYAVFFGFFGTLFYIDNRKRYHSMRPDLIKKELIRLVSSLGIAEVFYLAIRWTLQFYLLEQNYEPYIASLIAEAVATAVYMVIVSVILRITKVFH